MFLFVSHYASPTHRSSLMIMHCTLASFRPYGQLTALHCQAPRRKKSSAFLTYILNMYIPASSLMYMRSCVFLSSMYDPLQSKRTRFLASTTFLTLSRPLFTSQT